MNHRLEDRAMRFSTVALSVFVSLVIGATCLAADGGTNVGFVKTQLDDKYRSEGVAVADFNGDSRLNGLA